VTSWRWTAGELRGSLVEGSISVREVAAEHLERLAALDGVIGSCVAVDATRTLREAEELDERRRCGGRLGALHGVPIVIKDTLDVAGLPTRLGAAYLDGAAPAAVDSAVVARLRAAGALILAKSATHELAAGVETPGIRNPWDHGRSAGGSSGGSAAAVAAHLAALAIGTDALGSVRVPAAYCGVVGLKPTYGRISTRGSHPLAWSLDHVGTFARSVADTRSLASALLDLPDPPTTSSRRLGLPRQLLDGVGAQARGALDAAVGVLRGAGYHVLELDLPDLRDALPAAYALVAAEAATIHRRTTGQHLDHLDDGVRALLLAGSALPAVTYLIARQVRRHLVELVRRCLEEHDLVGMVAPVTAGTAHRREQRNAADGAPITVACVRPNALANLTGQPSVAVPVELDADGLPLAVQVVGAPHDEAGVLTIAEVLETASSDLRRRRAALA
jgi:aspartyl-tRNA(Asn)/glutamyl-tRNA(Gln) amidotransferase subunit A